MEAFAERYMRVLRDEYFRSALRQEHAWYDKHTTAAIASRLNELARVLPTLWQFTRELKLTINCSSDVERVREGIGDKLSMALQHTATFVAGFLIGFLRSWQLTLVLASFMPITVLVNSYFGKVGFFA